MVSDIQCKVRSEVLLSTEDNSFKLNRDSYGEFSERSDYTDRNNVG